MKRKEIILQKDVASEILHLFNEEKMRRKDIAAKFGFKYRKVCDLIRHSKLDTQFTKEEEAKMEDIIEHHRNKRKVSVSELRTFFPNITEYTIRNKRDSIYRCLNFMSKSKARKSIPDTDKIIQSTAVAVSQEPVATTEFVEKNQIAIHDTSENNLTNETEGYNDHGIMHEVNGQYDPMYPQFDEFIYNDEFQNKNFAFLEDSIF